MKKYSLYILGAMLLLTGNIFAQAPKLYSTPAAFTVNEDITVYFDVTGTALDGATGNIYLWSWSDAGDNINNGSWGQFNNMLTKVEGQDNLYYANINIARDYPVGATQIQGLVVNEGGTAQTDDSEPLVSFDFTNWGGRSAIVYPATYTATTPISIIVNLNNGGNIDLNTSAVHMHSGMNAGEKDWQYEVGFNSDLNKTALSKVEGYEGVWRINITPYEYYGAPQNSQLVNIIALFNNGTWDQKLDDNGSDFVFIPKSTDEGPTAARFFLGRFTADDVLPVIVNTTAFDAPVTDPETGDVTEAGDPLYGFNGDTMTFRVKLTVGSEGDAGYKEEIKQIAARKTADNTYQLVLLPSHQFEIGAQATDIEVSFLVGDLSSNATLSASFIK